MLTFYDHFHSSSLFFVNRQICKCKRNKIQRVEFQSVNFLVKDMATISANLHFAINN